MKKIITILAITLSSIVFAQVPQGISYQAIAMDNSGNPVVSANVGLRLSILDNSATGTVLYTETHIKTTNAQGLYNLIIGQGATIFGAFNTINWSTNSKFLKVEMDVAGGTNYLMIGTTQLLSVPYALAADSLITSPGEGITLVSPNGTPYQVTVNDSGQLSLPTSSTTSSLPATLYMYGTFNSYNASTSLLLGNVPSYNCTGVTTVSPLIGYKYLTSGTEIKFLSQNNASSPIYGINASNEIVLNGSSYTVSSNGFYFIDLERLSPNNRIDFSIYNFSPKLYFLNSSSTINPTYNVATNTFSFVVNGVTSNSNNNFGFIIDRISCTFPQGYNFGDTLSDGSIDYEGSSIMFPGLTSTPKNYRVDLVINFNGSGNYTITQIP